MNIIPNVNTEKESDQIISTGAKVSPIDPRTILHGDLVTAVAPLVKGGIVYGVENIEHQHNVGICTAISLVQNREKVNGRKYSPEFQYLLQKKYYDLDYEEGSSIFSALKVGKNYGFLPLELWTHTTEQDRYLPYNQYIQKLTIIPQTEIQRLVNLCVDKISGYASVDVSDPQAIARAINESEAGILCRYGCGSTWWLPSWLPQDINPLRRPIPETSGHAIGMTMFDYSNGLMQKLANTWGINWNLQGNADINWSNYPMTEAWAILRNPPSIPPPPFKFLKDLSYGMMNSDVIQLQKRLGLIHITGYFGPLTKATVIYYQTTHGIPNTGYVGILTRTSLNNS